MPLHIANLGRALSVIARHEACEAVMHEDVSAFGAPGECHALVSRGEDRRLRQARKVAAGIAGVRFALIEREAVRRLGPAGYRRALERATAIAYARFCPYLPR